MSRQLHILVNPPDDLVRELLANVPASGDVTVEVEDLNQPEPDYAALVEKVFAADAVATW